MIIVVICCVVASVACLIACLVLGAFMADNCKDAKNLADKVKILTCKQDGKHKLIVYVKTDYWQGGNILLAFGYNPWPYYFKCKNCDHTEKFAESELSKEQRAILVAMGILKKKGVK